VIVTLVAWCLAAAPVVSTLVLLLLLPAAVALAWTWSLAAYSE
jgi:hypothetical protein